MRSRRAVLGLATALLLAGCASYPKHELRIFSETDRRPVRTVLVLAPAFPTKVKRALPEDVPEMLPERRAESAEALRAALAEILSASVTVTSGPVPDAVVGWADALQKRYLKDGAVPSRVDPVDAGADAVLLPTVRTYGTDRNQYSYQLFWMKPRWIGTPTWDHTCDLEAVLIYARDGAVLFDARVGELVNTKEPDPTALGRATRAALGGLLRGFPPASATSP